MLNPTSVATMLLVGYLLAVALQMLFGFGYTRLGPGTLLTADDQWSNAYFGLTGASWVVTTAIATFVTLPLAEAAGGKQCGEAAILLDVLLILLIIVRNRKQNPRLQSIAMTLLLSFCIIAGSVLGAIVRLRHPATTV